MKFGVIVSERQITQQTRLLCDKNITAGTMSAFDVGHRMILKALWNYYPSELHERALPAAEIDISECEKGFRETKG